MSDYEILNVFLIALLPVFVFVNGRAWAVHKVVFPISDIARVALKFSFVFIVAFLVAYNTPPQFKVMQGRGSGMDVSYCCSGNMKLCHYKVVDLRLPIILCLIFDLVVRLFHIFRLFLDKNLLEKVIRFRVNLQFPTHFFITYKYDYLVHAGFSVALGALATITQQDDISEEEKLITDKILNYLFFFLLLQR